MGNGTVILKSLTPVFEDMAKFSWSKVKEAINQSETVQTIPPLPKFEAEALSSLPKLPTLPTLPRLQVSTADIIPSAQASQEVPPTVTESYAAEMEDTSVACIPCTRRHISTMATAGQEAARAMNDYRIRREFATIAAEGLVMKKYDWAADKLAGAKEQDRRVIMSIYPDMEELLSTMPTAPEQLLLAWGATNESRRFARSRKPTEKDHAQIALRMSDTEGWIGYTESNLSGSSPALDLIRKARHEIVDNGYTLAALDAAEAKLGEAVTLLTPMPDPETVRRVAKDTAAIKDRFFDQVISAMRSQHIASPGPSWIARVSPFGDGKDWHLDRDTRLPAQLKRFLERSGETTTNIHRNDYDPNLPFGGLMGATEQTKIYFTNLLRFARSQGITVRERSLPATDDYILNGAYSPSLNTAVVSAQANAEDNESLQTVNHELSHALKDNPHCLLHPTPPEQYEAEYAETNEEREADLINLLVFTELNMPLEMSDGSTLPTWQWHVDRKKLKQEVDPLTFTRVIFGADILIQAAKTGSARVGMCPIR